MKLFHLSDLHLGKRLCEVSLLEDQEYILKRILELVEEERPDAVLIAGDVYDKSVPSQEAVTLFDWFLTALSQRNVPVLAISGNHDSPERMAFGSHLMASAGVYVAPVWNGEVEPVTLRDEWGEVDFFLLPFLKPAHVRNCYEEEVGSYTDAMRLALSGLKRTAGRRSVLVTHQFVTGATRSESEEISVGGSDNVDASVFESFDYVALGHIHSPQNCGSEKIRYSGTPLKYSFSEAKDEKSVTVVELSEGDVSVRTLPLEPMREMVHLRGTYEELMRKSFYEGTTYQKDYVYITLTDEEDVVDAVGKLRVIYRYLMKLEYDNKRTRSNARVEGDADVESKTPLELFADFYEMQNNQPMNEVQKSFVLGLIEQIWEEEV